MRLFTLLTLMVLAAQSRGLAADADLPSQASAALEKATAYITSISTHGGYLWRYSLDLKKRAGEVAATDTQIWVQPPGTPAMGKMFLRALEATGDTRYLEAARAAAEALAVGQLESGGWDYPVDFDPQKMRLSYLRSDIGKISAEDAAKRKNRTTFDDNTTQSALRLLLAFVDAAKDHPDPRDARIREALDYGLKKMIEAQYPIGAWPQRWDGKPHKAEEFPVLKARYPESYPRVHPKQLYYSYYTLNDNAQRDCILLMLDAWHRTGKREYLESVKKGGDFLILAQMPEPQPVWAQQYNAHMEPAWARAFEPPSVTGGESVGALQTLMDLYKETGDDKYLKPIPAAIAWYKHSAIGTNLWARYYELHTNKPLYGDRNGKIYYRLEEISDERQHGYSWHSSYHVPEMMKAYEKLKTQGREGGSTTSKTKSPKPRLNAAQATSLEPRVRKVIADLDGQGRWVTKGHQEKRDWEFDDRIETSVFIANAALLSDYLQAVQK
jgi:hypothetical protein